MLSFGENKVECSGSLWYWDAADLGVMMHIEIALLPPALSMNYVPVHIDGR